MKLLFEGLLVLVLIAFVVAEFESDAEKWEALITQERACKGEGVKGCYYEADDWCCKKTPCKCPAWSHERECRCTQPCNPSCRGKRALMVDPETHRMLSLHRLSEE
uniref:U1-sicaritoxin-Li1b n=1 Tax=Loxosceles intermedia TaxID=58218 RepID=TX2_LOXIN|nr:RecName: Full=U1-sicaritoxin-Li1b; Short=U1-SCRTX-Li1b; AltName: Full=LiTx2; Flags: Precursor [Loxosceles intermedia]AAT85611.1 toxin 2 [Loxosceles intermedia]